MLTWENVLAEEKQKPYFQKILAEYSKAKQQNKIIYPPQKEIFNAFKQTEFHQVKIVILGQDPYHGPGQAHGLAFSVNHDIAIPPSLLNIYKELTDDIQGFTIPKHGCLIDWAKQGVFLLNTVLTVEQYNANSHVNFGWQIFTDQVIQKLSDLSTNLVFMLWGSHAQKKIALINQAKHLILTAPHPSPLSAYRGFLGCKHFSKANDYLQQNNQQIINWQI